MGITEKVIKRNRRKKIEVGKSKIIMHVLEKLYKNYVKN